MIHPPKTMLLGPDTENAAMRIEMFVLCETAQEFGGRLNLLGTFEGIKAPALPAVFPGMTAAIRFRFWPEEVGVHHVALHLIDPDGQLVIPEMEADFAVPAEDTSRSSNFNLIVRLQNVSFEHAGEHSMDCYLDGDLEASLPLEVGVSDRMV